MPYGTTQVKWRLSFTGDMSNEDRKLEMTSYRTMSSVDEKAAPVDDMSTGKLEDLPQCKSKGELSCTSQY